MKKIHERVAIGQFEWAPPEWASFVALAGGSAHTDTQTGSRLTPEYLADRLRAGFNPFNWAVGTGHSLVERLVQLGNVALFDTLLAEVDLGSVVFEKTIAFKIISHALKDERLDFAEKLFAAGFAGYSATALDYAKTMARFEAGLDNLKATGAIAGADELLKMCLRKDANRAKAFLSRGLLPDGSVWAAHDIRDAVWVFSSEVDMIRTVCDRYALRDVIERNEGILKGSPVPKLVGYGKTDAMLDLAQSVGLAIDGRSEKGLTGLMVEMAARHTESSCAAAALDWIKRGADVRAVDGEGNSVLRHAVLNGRAEVVDILRDAGADLMARNAEGRRDFVSANAAGAYCEYLLGRTIPSGRNLAMIAVAAAWPEKLREAFANGDDPAHRDDYGNTVLDVALDTTVWHAAPGAKLDEVFQIMARAGVDMNAPVWTKVDKVRTARHPLHYLVEKCEESKKHFELLGAYLSASGIDLDVKDEKGFTALYSAVKMGDDKVVKLLLDAGADTGVRCGRFTLMGQAKSEVIKKLLRSATTGDKVVDALEVGVTADVPEATGRSRPAAPL